MTAEILDGRDLAARMRRRLAKACQTLGHPVRLVSLEVGENPAARVYVRGQKRAADDIGIELVERHLPAASSEQDVLAAIDACNRDPNTHGILVQRPLPLNIDQRIVQAAIAPGKDVEGMHPANMGTILYEHPSMIPCTAAAAEIMVQSFERDLRGAEAVVVGHSEIVGKPIAILLLHHLATVTVCHIGTRKLTETHTACRRSHRRSRQSQVGDRRHDQTRRRRH